MNTIPHPDESCKCESCLTIARSGTPKVDVINTVKELQDELLTIKGSISKLRLRIRKIEGVLL